jgi:hypothetical protein
MFLKNRPEIPVPSLAPSDHALSDSMKSLGAKRVRHLVVLKGGREE